MAAVRTEIVQGEDGGLTEVSYNRAGRAVAYRPLTWGSLPDYLRWLIDNIDRLPMKFKTPELRAEVLAVLTGCLREVEPWSR